MRTSVELLYFEAGGGHRAAMRALSSELRRSYPAWTVVATDLQELLLPVDPVFLATRVKSQDVYNGAIARGWTLGSRPYLRAMQTAISLHSATMERTLKKHWERSRPDMVVSLVPNFNGIAFRSLRSVSATTPYVTVMTDIADTPPRFWQEPQDQFLICGSAKAELQAQLTGWYRPERVFRVSGMMLSPSFYAPPGEPPITRDSLGLDAGMLTTLISFGGNGSPVAATILDQLDAALLPMQSIVLCGRNEKLQAKLAQRPRCHAVGFTDRVADYMRLADIFIGKPGPGSISEALHMGLPVIVESNARTLVQERYNTTWVEERGVGIALASFAQIDTALRHLARDSVLATFRARAQAMPNRAVFEVPAILAGIGAEAGNASRLQHHERVGGDSP